MARGQSIRIFLADGSVTGIRHAEVVNWTGQAVACPRSRIGELGGWEEAHRPGVYLLFGTDEASGRAAVYVGEAENVLVRLQDHLSKKDFWNEVVLFTNKDQNLTKAHVRFLESRLVDAAGKARRYVVTNSAQPQGSLLPRGDRDSMESFLDQIRVLLGVLGHRVLEPLAAAIVPDADEPQAGISLANVPAAGNTLGKEFFLSSKGIKARAVQSDEGLVVLTGSLASLKSSPSLSVGYQARREELQQQGSLVQKEGYLEFTEDCLFSSPSAAAATIVGYPVNGRDAWKTADGISFGYLEKRAVGIAG